MDEPVDALWENRHYAFRWMPDAAPEADAIEDAIERAREVTIGCHTDVEPD